MRRAYLEASSFAREREAFGGPIAAFPLVRENLAVMKAEAAAALASSLHLTSSWPGSTTAPRPSEDVAWHRILVNANKFVTSLAATQSCRRGIEALGGNGTIEDFSPLPRLYRDAIVFESWEGTHNVLCAQVLRDLAQTGRRRPRARARGRACGARPETAPLGRGRRTSARCTSAVSWTTLVRALQVACLRAEGNEPAAELHERRHLTPGYDPEADPDYADLIDRSPRLRTQVTVCYLVRFLGLGAGSQG